MGLWPKRRAEGRAGEAESSFATMGADDVALDMDTEVGFITEARMILMIVWIRISQNFSKSFVTSVTPLKRPRSSQPVLTEPFGVRKSFD
jgi:hypothetical protein